MHPRSLSELLQLLPHAVPTLAIAFQATAATGDYCGVPSMGMMLGHEL